MQKSWANRSEAVATSYLKDKGRERAWRMEATDVMCAEPPMAESRTEKGGEWVWRNKKILSTNGL